MGQTRSYGKRFLLLNRSTQEFLSHIHTQHGLGSNIFVPSTTMSKFAGYWGVIAVKYLKCNGFLTFACVVLKRNLLYTCDTLAIWTSLRHQITITYGSCLQT